MNHKSQPLAWSLAIHQETDLIQLMPELEILKYVVEQNDWHNDDPLQQSLRLFHWMKRLPISLLETIIVPEDGLQSLLTSVMDSAGHYKIQELLAFAALIHDMGKAKTFQRLPDGTTRCPGHEAVSARLAPAICARFNFTSVETDFITTLVGAHGEPYALLKRIAALPAPQRQEQIYRFETDHADHLLPLLLLAFGDLVTSHLQTIRPKKYEAVLDFYRRWLQSIWPGGEQESTAVQENS